MQLNGVHAPQKIALEIPEAGVQETMTADAAGRASFHFTATLELWSPAHPNVYDVVVKCGDDSVHDQIGFRTIEVQGPTSC